MGRANCDSEMRVYKDPVLGGDDGGNFFGAWEYVHGGDWEEDLGYELFEEWLEECDDFLARELLVGSEESVEPEVGFFKCLIVHFNCITV